jgi:hypothetical protein
MLDENVAGLDVEAGVLQRDAGRGRGLSGDRQIAVAGAEDELALELDDPGNLENDHARHLHARVLDAVAQRAVDQARLRVAGVGEAGDLVDHRGLTGGAAAGGGVGAEAHRARDHGNSGGNFNPCQQQKSAREEQT